ncbi:xylan 1,4-beta-xylosidase [Streptomyces gobiensis]|uniref:xylan 1,4-beta-xylosidase n=1 Tax=Streptomyces gobiensis TaxID=2875706 RepID=UPI001E303777|nr:xylan 1,4-beta-xylosidase [Streptomyces gobiensis]UGY90571.1 xylan 1,4-beta-xylosidase [Streptomyces gobiensis]
MGRHTGECAVMRVERWRLAGLIGAGVVALALLLSMCGFPSGGWRDDSRGPGEVYGTPRMPGAPPRPELGWGFTHTQLSADEGEKQARERAADALSQRSLPQNQHIMGWGADNPEPSPGRYDFTALDSRIELVRRTGGTPVITLCCAPDWMKGGSEGTTDWSKLETAPSRAHYKDFARLAGKVAERYPDVRHFIVWNEFKGFFDDRKKRWDYEGYTELYNLVYDELKRVREDNLVGGPYVVMDSVASADSDHASAVSGDWGSIDQRALDAVTYWNQHKRGADFVVIDGASYTKDQRLLPDEFAATEKFTAASRWVRKETGLPLWWAEWYVELSDENDQRDGWSERHRLAVHATGMIAMARGGAGTGFYWNPQRKGEECAGCLWRSTHLPDGGRKLPILELLSRFGEAFPPGTRHERVPVSGDDRVRLLASAEAILVVNPHDRPVQVTVDGQSIELTGYEVRWLRR